jgi:hypothetical protein
MAAAREGLDNHVPAATDTNAIPEELFETVFSTRSVLRVINKTIGAT